MAKIRIVCKRPAQPVSQPGPGIVLNGIVSTGQDVHVYVEDADGLEDELVGVTFVRWTATADGDPTFAEIHVADVEVDIETDAEVKP